MQCLGWPDYLLFGVFLTISLGIGIYHALSNGRQRTTNEFIMADRKLNCLPTAISMFVSFESAIAILGFTAEIYTRGGQLWILILLSTTIARITVERIIVPWFYPLKVTSLFEYLQIRFRSQFVRIVGALCGICNTVAYIGMSIYAPSVALSGVTGFPLSLSIPLMAFVGTTYTAVGGIKAVIWTDVFQFLVMCGGLIASLVMGTMQTGGLADVWDLAKKTGRQPALDFSLDPTVRHTFWGGLIGLSFSLVHTYGLTQAAVQRIVATRTENHARMSVLLSIPCQFVFVSVINLTGMVTFAYYYTVHCDPLKSGQISNPNQILPLFVTWLFRNVPGMSGLFIATLFSGALSTVSSCLSGGAAITWMDIVRPAVPHWSDYQGALFNKFMSGLAATVCFTITGTGYNASACFLFSYTLVGGLTMISCPARKGTYWFRVVIYGIVSTVIAFGAAHLPGPITQITTTVLGCLQGPVLGLFFVGGLLRFVNSIGAAAGTLSGLAFSIWLIVGASIDGSTYRRNPPLPPGPTDKCFSSVNSTTASLMYANITQQSARGYSSWHNMSLVMHEDQIKSNGGFSNFYAISYCWYSVIGFAVTVLVSSVVSLLSRPFVAQERHLDERVFIKFGYGLVYPFWKSRRKDQCLKKDAADEKSYISDTHEAYPMNAEGLNTTVEAQKL